MGKIASIFTYFAKKKSDADFAKHLQRKFGEESAQRVMDTFDKINMSISTEGIQYLKSNEGCVDFKNKYDEVIHVEPHPPGKITWLC